MSKRCQHSWRVLILDESELGYHLIPKTCDEARNHTTNHRSVDGVVSCKNGRHRHVLEVNETSRLIATEPTPWGIG